MLMESASTDAAAVEKDLHYAFMVFDADDNGLISPAELARLLRGLGRPPPSRSGCSTFKHGKLADTLHPNSKPRREKIHPYPRGFVVHKNLHL